MKFLTEALGAMTVEGPMTRRRRNGNRENFGGNTDDKQDNICRIGCRNIGGFPSKENQSEKYNMLRAESAENGLGLDIQSFIEVNRRWN